ncbi:hypothetical protein ACFLYN_05520 [Chloroflexota bacterium]
MNIIESYRSELLAALMAVPSFKTAWPKLKSSLLSNLPDHHKLTKRDIFDLGDHLSEAFLSVGGTREQSSVGQAGIVWEGLIAWYLNLCLCGTKAVAIKGRKHFIPQSVDKALTVSYQNSSLRTETDILIVYLNKKSLDSSAKYIKKAVEQYKNIVDSNISDINIINLQCKTNWNDIAQIPMLWNLIYSPSFTHNDVTVGINGYTLSNFKNFLYAFVTVPTQKKYNFTSTCLPVLRVKTCSGGNYWGKQTLSNIAFSIKMIFQKNHNCLPALSSIGNGYSYAIKNNSSDIDWKIFSLY